MENMNNMLTGEKKPVQEIINEFFKGREATPIIIKHYWQMFYRALASEESDNIDRIELANMAYDFERVAVLIFNLGHYRE